MTTSGQEEVNKALMARIAQAFAHGDLEPLVGILDKDVVWVSHSPIEWFRFGGVHRMREGVKELLALAASGYVFHRFEPQEIVAEGETVWGLFSVEATHQASKRLIKWEQAIRWVVRNGKVVSHEGFFDTASILIQQGQLPAGESP